MLEKARALEANKLGIDVTDQQVDEQIASIKTERFSGSEAKFQTELKKEGLTEAEARAIITRQPRLAGALDAHRRRT